MGVTADADVVDVGGVVIVVSVAVGGSVSDLTTAVAVVVVDVLVVTWCDTISDDPSLASLAASLAAAGDIK